MIQYVFYETDESFDFDGPFGTQTYVDYAQHGFEINNDYDFDSFHAYGDYDEMNSKCKSLEDVINYIIEHLGEIQETNEVSYEDNFERFNEFIAIVDDLKKVA